MKKYFAMISAFVAILALGGLTPALADTTNPPTRPAWGQMRRMMGRPEVVGTVSTISGNTITVNGRQGFGPKQPTGSVTYTVDASNATVIKDRATSTVSAIVSGDMVAIQGTVSGTNIAATLIRDGKPPMGGMGKLGGEHSTTSPIQGNGQPVVAGNITAINGSSITITNKSNVTYTVDASSAKVFQGKNTATLGNLSVGNMVIVQGTVNGTSITASSIITQAQPNNGNPPGPRPGFFGRVGQFFKNIFGF